MLIIAKLLYPGFLWIPVFSKQDFMDFFYQDPLIVFFTAHLISLMWNATDVSSCVSTAIIRNAQHWIAGFRGSEPIQTL